MTKHEKWSLILSVIAIALSIATPIGVYYIFNPVLQELKYAGKLLVDGRFLYDDSKATTYELTLTNVGKKPLDNITVGLMAINSSIEIPQGESDILVVPITPFEFKREGSRAYVKIEKTLAEYEELTVHISGLDFPEEAHLTDLRVDVSSSTGIATRTIHIYGTGGGF